MARTESTMLDLGVAAPEFSLPEPLTGKLRNLDDFRGNKGLVIVFMCNHCPYVKHIQQGLIDFANDYQQRGIQLVAINSNDVENYPDDAPDKMAEDAKGLAYPFPYLFDEDQSVAKAYQAACTPDLYLFDQDLKLVYRGQFDSSRPRVENPLPVTGEDLRHAADALLAGEEPVLNQIPSLGCNIKWKPGNEPDYFA
jgi:peroxiredoxin